MKNVFDVTVTEELIARINKLRPDSKQKWGKMNAAQMLAHCNVSYEMVYDNIHPKPRGLKKFILKNFLKPVVVSGKDYRKNTPTATQFKISTYRDFSKEKERLTQYIRRTQELGPVYFESLESNSFGVLSSNEWNNMFFKHIDHHLTQFEV